MICSIYEKAAPCGGAAGGGEKKLQMQKTRR